jgi:spore photoproduct lyase
MQTKLSEYKSLNTSAPEVSCDMPSVKFSDYEALDGRTLHLVKQVGDGVIIKRFDKTPVPKEPTDVVCPHFLELKWANGCSFDCAWCYLNGTFRFREQKKAPYLKDPERILIHLNSFFQGTNGTEEVLNSGELADSLVFEGKGFSLCRDIIPVFKEHKTHRLLILTKSANIKNLLESESQNVVIPSFSLNAYPVAEQWEKKAPHPRLRIKAAKELAEAGYQVRIRIDPMVPIDEWQKEYFHLVDDIFKSFRPERITLGSLRGLKSTITHCKDISWVKFLDDTSSNWGRKVNLKTRYHMYHSLIAYLRFKYDYYDVALCKESVEMWKALKMDYQSIRCNCTP